MTGQAGDRIILESERVGKPPREGEILEVRVSPAGTNYRVRWDDGHESEFRPAAGSCTIVPKEQPKGEEVGSAP